MILENELLQLALGMAQAVLLLLCAPLVTGIVKKVKAWMQNRIGSSIWQEYYQRVTYGATDDLQSTIDEMNQKLYDAGLQDIIDEKQKQLDAVLNG